MNVMFVFYFFLNVRIFINNFIWEVNVEIQNNFNEARLQNMPLFVKIKNYFLNYDTHNWMAFLGIFVFTITMNFTIIQFIEFVSGDKTGWRIFFGIFDRFTYQSNWLLFFYTLLYLIKPNHQFFKGNKFLISTMVYIFFTFIGYNVVLVGISGDRGYSGDAAAIASNVWLHIIAPLYFICFGLVKMYYNYKSEPNSFLKTLIMGMIYPTVYAIYLSTIPFVFVDYRLNPENYPYPNGHNLYENQAYSIYGNATNTYNNPMSWAYIGVMYFLFFPSSFALFYYAWKGFNKLNDKIKNK